jgi:small subunit ribosomal protein S1
LTENTIQGWLTEEHDYQRPIRGQIREGVILRIEERGIIIDVGLKREGIVSHQDVQRLGKEFESQLQPGKEVVARIVRPEDREGNLVLSLYQARLEKDWTRAREMLESGELWHGQVTGCNRGGLTVQFGGLYGFVPGSHLWRRGRRRLSAEQREEVFREYIGQELPLKVIEVERGRRRLILSERLARRQLRKRRLEGLLDELLEGQVCQGTVSRLCDFGAFVDLGGADGLIHISELAWQRVKHPREVLKVGDEIQVYILRLDHKRKRIELSLKRLQPDPWSLVDLTYSEGQLVSGVVSGLADFGAFVALSVGVEGLVHISELDDPPPEKPEGVVKLGDELVLRILRIDTSRRRIGLSLKRVTDEDRDRWFHRTSTEEADEEVAASETMPLTESGGTSAVGIDMVEEVMPGVPEQV